MSKSNTLQAQINITKEVVSMLATQHEQSFHGKPFLASDEDVDLVKTIINETSQPLDVVMADYVRLDSRHCRLIDKGWVFDGVFFYESEEDADTHSYDYFGCPAERSMQMSQKGEISLPIEYVVFREATKG